MVPERSGAAGHKYGCGHGHPLVVGAWFS